MAKKPSFQFYPGDWRKDQNLSRASLQAKGALIEVLCLAFECEKRGYLITDKTPWTIEEIAHAIGGDKMENMKALEELLMKKILKIDKKNCIFSARMVRDEKVSKLRRRAGSMGGNPNLVNQTSNQNLTPSSSSSSSTSVNIETWETEKGKFLNDGKWIFKFCSDKKISVDFFDRTAKEFLGDLELKEDFKPIKEIRSHFTNWFNLKKEKVSAKNGSEETHELPSRLTRLQ